MTRIEEQIGTKDLENRKINWRLDSTMGIFKTINIWNSQWLDTHTIQKNQSFNS